MIDAVYFLASRGSHYQDEELRYSLRSLEQHVAGVGRVFVLGPRLAWWKNIDHVPAKDPLTFSDANIIRKMHLACHNPEISDPFLFVNDDHYFTRNCQAAGFPFFHKGELAGNSANRAYARRVSNTKRELHKRGLPVLNFDLHTPIRIYKEAFLTAFAAGWVWEKLPGVVMKSVYGNSIPELQGEYLEDLKLLARTRGTVAQWLELLKNRPCFSTGPYITKLVWDILKTLYPKPCKYEKGDAG